MRSLFHFAHSIRNKIWFVAVVVLFLLDLELRTYQVQAQVIQSSTYLNQKLSTATSASPISRPFGESGNHKTLEKVPSHMQSFDSNNDIRRFMWSEFDDTIGTLMHGFASGTDTANQKIITSTANKIKSSHRYVPVGSMAVKYIINKPNRSSVMKRYPQPNMPTTKLLYGPSSSVEYPKDYRVNYKMFEELALREWMKQQKSAEILVNEDNSKTLTLGLNSLGTSNSSHFEDWTPLRIEQVKPLIKLPKSVRNLKQKSLQKLSYATSEIGAQKTFEHYNQNPTLLTFSNQTIKSFNPTTTPGEDMGTFSKRKALKDLPLKNMSHLRNADLIPAETKANPINPVVKHGQKTFRGSLKFGDKLLK